MATKKANPSKSSSPSPTPPASVTKSRPPRPTTPVNIHWSLEEHTAAQAMAKALGLTLTSLVRMAVAAKCMELKEQLPKLERPAIQIPLVRASMEGTLAVHMHEAGERLVATLDKKQN